MDRDIVVELGGTTITFTRGRICCEDPCVIDRIFKAVDTGESVPLPPDNGTPVVADLRPGNPLGNLASLISPSPTDWVLLDGPDDLRRLLALRLSGERAVRA
jgi:hypothetical protein